MNDGKHFLYVLLFFIFQIRFAGLLGKILSQLAIDGHTQYNISQFTDGRTQYDITIHRQTYTVRHITVHTGQRGPQGSQLHTLWISKWRREWRNYKESLAGIWIFVLWPQNILCIQCTFFVNERLAIIISVWQMVKLLGFNNNETNVEPALLQMIYINNFLMYKILWIYNVLITLCNNSLWLLPWQHQKFMSIEIKLKLSSFKAFSAFHCNKNKLMSQKMLRYLFVYWNDIQGLLQR